VIEIIDSDMNQQDIADVGYKASAFWSLAPCFWNSVGAGFIPAPKFSNLWHLAFETTGTLLFENSNGRDKTARLLKYLQGTYDTQKWV
jgi:hypothetical protein